MTSLPLVRVFQCCLRSLSFPLRSDWRKSENAQSTGSCRGIGGGIQIASCPSFTHPAARMPRRAARRQGYVRCTVILLASSISQFLVDCSLYISKKLLTSVTIMLGVSNATSGCTNSLCRLPHTQMHRCSFNGCHVSSFASV